MGVILVDLANAAQPPHKDDLSCNWWNWRPTVEIIRTLNLVSDETLELMGSNAGAEVSEEQARKIGEHLRASVLPKLAPNARIRLDLTSTTETDDFKMHDGSDVDKNYSATAAWLVAFADFCMKCKGFSVC